MRSALHEEAGHEQVAMYDVVQEVPLGVLHHRGLVLLFEHIVGPVVLERSEQFADRERAAVLRGEVLDRLHPKPHLVRMLLHPGLVRVDLDLRGFVPSGGHSRARSDRVDGLVLEYSHRGLVGRILAQRLRESAHLFEGHAEPLLPVLATLVGEVAQKRRLDGPRLHRQDHERDSGARGPERLLVLVRGNPLREVVRHPDDDVVLVALVTNEVHAMFDSDHLPLASCSASCSASASCRHRFLCRIVFSFLFDLSSFSRFVSFYSLLRRFHLIDMVYKFLD